MEISSRLPLRRSGLHKHIVAMDNNNTNTTSENSAASKTAEVGKAGSAAVKQTEQAPGRKDLPLRAARNSVSSPSQDPVRSGTFLYMVTTASQPPGQWVNTAHAGSQ